MSTLFVRLEAQLCGDHAVLAAYKAWQKQTRHPSDASWVNAYLKRMHRDFDSEC
jgi:hypothetical protein